MAAVARCLEIAATVVVAAPDVVNIGCLPEATGTLNLTLVARCFEHGLPVVLVPVRREPAGAVGGAPAPPRI
ncbi:hypothetical protein SEA_MAVERICK_1 [Mycobacterium phage Maverick]|uniref:Uncharacterized protein n=3 Tax=Backyardiganvirus peaches TaxID=663557 RepID=G1JZT6_9CAUD|nr:hypothetical protein TIROTHETA9_1 [Mycobacterium phage TiroTheta9]ALF01059.1 hypothetical protein SEA_MAVERICK_1 [Mycobacterium phage Maverick]ALH46287.1 hypothetical protein PBI_CAELAKIN_1 [Mycobacterium phage Caelakin]